MIFDFLIKMRFLINHWNFVLFFSKAMEPNPENSEFKPSFRVIDPPEDEKKNLVFTSLQEKIAEAERLKTLGNDHFKNKDYKKAIGCYHKVFFFLNGIIDPKDEMAKYVSRPSELATKETLEKVNPLKVSTYLNMSQIYLYEGKYSKAIEMTSKSLDIMKSVKGFYRRGLAYIELNEFEKARKDLESVREMEKEQGVEKNEDLDQKFLLIKHREKAYDDSLKKKFKNMFI